MFLEVGGGISCIQLCHLWSSGSLAVAVGDLMGVQTPKRQGAPLTQGHSSEFE